MNLDIISIQYLSGAFNPLKSQTSNWVPTTEGMDDFLYFRPYGPKGPFFDKSWQLPNLEKTQ